VTPIDWKLPHLRSAQKLDKSRQSLVTPIDWKRPILERRRLIADGGRQSLVTPIDWKLDQEQALGQRQHGVANPW
jgi:hypothetical protein